MNLALPIMRGGSLEITLTDPLKGVTGKEGLERKPPLYWSERLFKSWTVKGDK